MPRTGIGELSSSPSLVAMHDIRGKYLDEVFSSVLVNGWPLRGNPIGQW